MKFKIISAIVLVLFSLKGFAGNPMAPPAFIPQPKKDATENQQDGDKDKQSAPKDTREFRLAQIIYSDSRRVAVINNRIVVEGSFLNKAKVMKINRRSVELTRNSKSILITLDSVKVKKIKNVKRKEQVKDDG